MQTQIKTAPKPSANKAAIKKAEKPAPAKTTKAEKPAIELHNYKPASGDASPFARGHGKKLSPIDLSIVPSNFTDRDRDALKFLHTKFGAKQFKRLDSDAGIIRRLVGHGYIAHKSGDLAMRDCTFALTAEAISYFKSA